MSGVLWCDTGNHAFSVNDVNRQHFTQTRTISVRAGDNLRGEGIHRGPDGYSYQDRQEVTTELDICGACYTKQSVFLEGKKEDSNEEK